MTETTIREEGLDLQKCETAFLWYSLSRDFQRQLIEANPILKTKIDRHILAALNGYASYPATFYSNAFCYVKNNLSQQRDLEYYANRIFQMFKEQAEQEYNARIVRAVDYNGRIVDQFVI